MILIDNRGIPMKQTGHNKYSGFLKNNPGRADGSSSEALRSEIEMQDLLNDICGDTVATADCPDFLWEESPSLLQKDTGRGKTILIVEDHPDVVQVTRSMLESVGYRTLVAFNGLQALDIYRKNAQDISLVLLDLLMPLMSGQDCLNELIKINPNVRVLAISGFFLKEDVTRQLGRRIKGFLSKPCRWSTLIQETSAALN